MQTIRSQLQDAAAQFFDGLITHEEFRNKCLFAISEADDTAIDYFVSELISLAADVLPV